MSFSGLWPGIVVDNRDPLREGRLRVRTTHFGSKDSEHRIPDGDLPWAFPCAPVANKNSGFIMLPEIGSGVWIMFYQEQSDHPVWLGGWFGTGDKIDEHDYTTGRPQTFVIKTPGGQKVLLSDLENAPYIKLEDAAGQSIILNPKDLVAESNFLGDYRASIAGNDHQVVAGERVEMVTGNILMETAATMTLKAATALILTGLGAVAISAMAGLSMVITGLATVAATTAVHLLSTSVILGEVASAQKLCNEAFLLLFNTHTHDHFPGPGAPTNTSIPNQVAVPNVHTTLNTKGS